MESISKSLRNIIITGANKGIGFALCQALSAPEFTKKYRVILTARNQKRGQSAVEKILVKYPKSEKNLFYHQLDISDRESIEKFVVFTKSKLGKFDCLVNNAAIRFKDCKDFSYKGAIPEEILKSTIDINYYGNINITKALLPYLAQDGKIVNITSQYGQLHKIKNKEYIANLSKDTLTEEKIDLAIQEFVALARNGKHVENGFRNSVYCITKTWFNAYNRFILPRLLGPKQQCYALCPGWVQSDLGGHEASLTLEQGIETPLFLINLPYGEDLGFNGKFFSQKEVIKY